MIVEKITLYTDNETLIFESQREVADYLQIKNNARSMILRRCKKLDYEIDFPLKKNEYPLK